MKRILFLQGVTWLLAAQLQVKPAARQHSNISPQHRTEPGPQYLNIVFSLHLGSFRIEHLRQAIPSDLEANQGSAYKDHQGHNFLLAYWLWMHLNALFWMKAPSMTPCRQLNMRNSVIWIHYSQTAREFLASVKKAWDKTCDFHAIGGLDIFALFCIEICRVCKFWNTFVIFILILLVAMLLYVRCASEFSD